MDIQQLRRYAAANNADPPVNAASTVNPGAGGNAEAPDKETLIETLLRDMARSRAASLRWNAQMMLMFYGLFVIVALLRLEDANIFLVTGLAAVGLGVLWIVARTRWRSLEHRLFDEELQTYHSIASPVTEKAVATAPEDRPLLPLSRRELEVLSKVAEGMGNKKIALVLGISSQTVKNHVSRILSKLEVEDRTSAVLLALSHGWITIDGQSGSVSTVVAGGDPPHRKC